VTTPDLTGTPLLDDDGRTLVREPVIVDDLAPGVALPYALDRIYGTFGDCRDGGRRQHRGLDLGGVGPDAGLGTPIRSMVRARITFIGRPEEDSAQFGRPDTRGGTTDRGGQALPRGGTVPGYGPVHFFTRDYGSWRSGTVIITEGIGAPLADHQIRYMHLGAVHPGLGVGDEVEAGQEIGLMGGTAVQNDLPHVHMDIETPDGERVDIAPLLGMAPDTRRCR
jgi:murein DD-endopeptidase MepM/ murein hydrolase activator NlpD